MNVRQAIEYTVRVMGKLRKVDRLAAALSKINLQQKCPRSIASARPIALGHTKAALANRLDKRPKCAWPVHLRETEHLPNLPLYTKLVRRGQAFLGSGGRLF
jgi:hypothetical protein